MSKILKKELIPIGSVVLLKQGTKPIMVYGRKHPVQEESGTKIYDYVACPYPEGYLLNAISFFFDHSKIDKILHMGYINEDEKYLKIELLST